MIPKAYLKKENEDKSNFISFKEYQESKNDNQKKLEEKNGYISFKSIAFKIQK